ncbi:DNA-formamidopyrimidine glycosylase family protein [Pengzhenrongella sicca]|uniref:DNA-(apurinic or apyrimidinic site) lyase n=1 Tax=Pengzhenrongella sicca TaxID=2819238 RepID=A0A8A4ZH58_9MICO|nr:DNA-formamidopyrimidine glycosylase family protein [Pengzhenrongella sicca]QTE30605.1 Fpg/Nei family DNA glycosylase [Pengzhenrongella sicca]
MPEGDILRRTAARLDQALTGTVLVRAELRWPTAAEVDLVGLTVLGTRAYGKHLLTRFDDGRSLHTHLRMEGSWAIARTGSSAAQARGPWVRVVLGAETWTAIGERIGMLDVTRTRDEHTVLGHLGPDLLAPDFVEAGLTEALARLATRAQSPVAEVLLDQRVAAGIGTIYAAESLYAHRLWPWTPAGDVNDPRALLLTARTLMARSVRATLPTATGDTARGRTTLVHGRLRLPCRRCGTPIAVGRAGAPGTDRPIFYCPVCQAR